MNTEENQSISMDMKGYGYEWRSMNMNEYQCVSLAYLVSFVYEHVRVEQATRSVARSNECQCVQLFHASSTVGKASDAEQRPFEVSMGKLTARGIVLYVMSWVSKISRYRLCRLHVYVKHHI